MALQINVTLLCFQNSDPLTAGKTGSQVLPRNADGPGSVLLLCLNVVKETRTGRRCSGLPPCRKLLLFHRTQLSRNQADDAWKAYRPSE